MMSGENFNRPPHLSEEQLAEHSRLYPESHASKLKEIEARLIKADTICVNPTYCQLRSLKKEQAYAINSVRMHALYFDNYGYTEERPSDGAIAFMNGVWLLEKGKQSGPHVLRVGLLADLQTAS